MLAFPLYILTLGLIWLIINAFLLWLTAWLTSFWNWGLRVEDFWWGVVAALIISLINWIFGIILRPQREGLTGTGRGRLSGARPRDRTRSASTDTAVAQLVEQRSRTGAHARVGRGIEQPRGLGVGRDAVRGQREIVQSRPPGRRRAGRRSCPGRRPRRS